MPAILTNWSPKPFVSREASSASMLFCSIAVSLDGFPTSSKTQEAIYTAPPAPYLPGNQLLPLQLTAVPMRDAPADLLMCVDKVFDGRRDMIASWHEVPYGRLILSLPFEIHTLATATAASKGVAMCDVNATDRSGLGRIRRHTDCHPLIALPTLMLHYLPS